MVHYKETNTAIDGHEWKISSEAVIYNPAYLVSKHGKTEYICGRFVIRDQVGTIASTVGRSLVCLRLNKYW